MPDAAGLLPSLPRGAPSSTAGCSRAPPLARAAADGQRLAAHGATHVANAGAVIAAHVEELVLARSSQSSTGFEGVYASGGGFGAELRKGTKRLRQDGYRSPVEAALERARWMKSLLVAKGHAPSAGAGASYAHSWCEQEQQFVPVSGFERPLWSLTEFEGATRTSRAGLDTGLQAGVKHQTGASGPFRVALERAGPTEEDFGAVSPSTTSSCAVLSPSTTTSSDEKHQGPVQAWRVQVPSEEPHLRGAVFYQEIGRSTFGTIFTLEEQFVACVMRNYTPRAPGELPTKQWVSCAQLLHHLPVQPLIWQRSGSLYEVMKPSPSSSACDLAPQWQPDYVKQLITIRFRDHPTFAGLSFNAWCKLLKEHDVPGRGGGKKSVMKFSFEYTPNWRFSHEW